MNLIKKLVTVTRKDLTLTQQAVQSTHAALDFVIKNPTIALDWHNSNYLVCLAASDEVELNSLIDKCSMRGLEFCVFREPDLNDEITAICIEPSEQTTKVTSNIPLMFKKEEKDIIVFHYNKKHNEDQNIPPWVVKHKGNTHYVHHLDVADGVSWNTKETPDNEHTKAALKIRGVLTLKMICNKLHAKIR